MAVSFLAPLFYVLGLSASSFRFRNLTGLTPPAPPTTAAPSGHLPSNPPRNIAAASSRPIVTHNVLCALRIASQPSGRASPGIQSDTRCLDRPARLLSVRCQEKRPARRGDF
jgi:hypothetical protein